MSQHSPTSFLNPKILIPFATITLIWGSTWFVIRGQIAEVPASWGVTYRFLVAGIAMLVLAAFNRQRIRFTAREFVYGDAIARRLKIADTAGVVAHFVKGNSPVAIAGLRTDDWIKEIDGVEVKTFAAATENEWIAPFQPGNDLAAEGFFNQQVVYLPLLVVMASADLAGVDQFGSRRGKFKQLLTG